jgi:hypothetical protein
VNREITNKSWKPGGGNNLVCQTQKKGLQKAEIAFTISACRCNQSTLQVLPAIGYDADTQTLTIEFRNGGTYEFFDVPQSTYHELMAAGSHGEYFARNIRGKYRYAKR